MQGSSSADSKYLIFEIYFLSNIISVVLSFIEDLIVSKSGHTIGDDDVWLK